MTPEQINHELTLQELRLFDMLIRSLDGMTSKIHALQAVIQRMEKMGETTSGNGADLARAWHLLEPHTKRLKQLLRELTQNGTRAAIAAHLLEETEIQ